MAAVVPFPFCYNCASCFDISTLHRNVGSPFSLATGLLPFEDIRARLERVYAMVCEQSGIAFTFDRQDPRAHANTHTFYLRYTGPLPGTNDVKVDVTLNEVLSFPLEDRPVLRGYPEFADLPENRPVLVYSLNEIAAEKTVALTDPARNEPRGPLRSLVSHRQRRTASGSNRSCNLPKIGIPRETLRRTTARTRAKGGSLARAVEYRARSPNACSPAVRTGVSSDASHLPPSQPPVAAATSEPKTPVPQLPFDVGPAELRTESLKRAQKRLTSWGGAFEICLKTASYKVKEEFSPF